MSKFLVSIQSLEKWFQRQKRVLPWRDQPTPYRVWISEIMLQQTQVVTVIPYFEKFVQRFPSVKDLAQAAEEEVLFYWSGLGYYSRARNLHRGAQMIYSQGRFPSSREEWLEIPGVGPYTAGAILSIANELPEAILDGNVERVLSRIRRVSREKGDQDFKSRLWKLSKLVVESSHRNGVSPSVMNQALMELGATLCSPKSPTCMLCPVSQVCQAFQRGEVSQYPPKKKPKQWVQVEERLQCWIGDSDRILLRKRTGKEWRTGLWDLVQEKPAFIREFKTERLGEIETRHIVTRHKIRRVTEVWKVLPTVKNKNWNAAEYSTDSSSDHFRWISIRSPEVAVGSALKKTIDKILERWPGAVE